MITTRRLDVAIAVVLVVLAYALPLWSMLADGVARNPADPGLNMGVDSLPGPEWRSTRRTKQATARRGSADGP